MKVRLGLASVVFVVLVFLAIRSFDRVRDLRRASATCEAVAAEDWELALDSSKDFHAEPETERRVVECRCVALVRTGRDDECSRELEERWRSPDHRDWIPAPMVSTLAIEHRRREGDIAGAAELAHRASVQYPESAALGLFELELRRRLENESAVLDDLTSRLGPDSPDPLRVQLAKARAQRNEWDEVLALTTVLPAPPNYEVGRSIRGEALGRTNQTEQLRALYGIAEPREATHPPDLARYAILLAKNAIRDPEAGPTELLRVALKGHDQFDEALLEEAYSVLIQLLAGDHDGEGIEETYREAKAVLGHDLPRFDEEEVERLRQVAEGVGSTGSGRIVIRIEGARRGDHLLVAPDPKDPIATPYRRLALDRDRLTLDRHPGAHPFRWVWLDAQERLCESGSLWPLGSRTTELVLERPTECREDNSPPLAARSPGDGRTRIVAVLPDSAEWRLVRLLQARQELPLLRRLEATGVSGTLHSDPPFTAAALKVLLFPHVRGERSVLDIAYGLGREIEGLNFVGRNPLAALEWFLPEDESLVDRLGSEDHRIASLLRSFGELSSGRATEIVGPEGRRERLEGFEGSRVLTEEEKHRFFPSIELRPPARDLIREMAADFDTIDQLVARPDIDLVLFRIASLDVMTHTYLPETNRTEQSHDDSFLLSAYRYTDHRLAQIEARLDEDDVLVVFSDHGAQTALEHHPSAIFFAAGASIPQGTLPGSPEIRGLGRWLADLWELDTDLPSTGIGYWMDDPSDGRPAGGRERPATGSGEQSGQ